jgi:acyl-coenzyme A thioesterase 13
MALDPAPNDAPPQDTAMRTAQVHALMQSLLAKSPIYGLILSDIQLTKVNAGSVTLQLQLSATHLNSKGGLHGAVSATIVDFVTGLAICSYDLREKTGASVDMHLSFLSTAKAGDTVLIHSTAERVGGSLAFVSIKINKLDSHGKETPVTLAQHTKYVKAPSGPAPRV